VQVSAQEADADGVRVLDEKIITTMSPSPPAISEVCTPLSRVWTVLGFGGWGASGSWPLADCGGSVVVVPSGAVNSVIALLPCGRRPLRARPVPLCTRDRRGLRLLFRL